MRADGRAVRTALPVVGAALTAQIMLLAQPCEQRAPAGFCAAKVKTLRVMLLRLYRSVTPLA